MTHVPIRNLELEDLPFAQELRRIAQWNQTDADWRRLLDFAGPGCYLIECEDRPAGTATTTVFAEQLAWIGMVLVHPAFRGRGLATAMLRRCLDYLLDDLEVPCVKLDATAEGQPLYSKLGFERDCKLFRWVGRMRPQRPATLAAALTPAVAPQNSAALSSGSREDWLALDRSVIGADRSVFLRRLAQDSLRVIECGPRGYGMLRQGAEASYLGPVVAADESTGRALVSDLLQTVAGQVENGGGGVYWDIPAENAAAERLAEQLGFARQRPLIRMWTGRSKLASDLAAQWAITGPETG